MRRFPSGSKSARARGTLALDRGARARAWLDGRDTATPDDVKAVTHACLRHRLILTYEAEAEGVTKDTVLDEILEAGCRRMSSLEEKTAQTAKG